jgi:hypothetical protein
MELLPTAFFVGFIGYLILQLMVSDKLDWGLREYFKQHGKIESMFIAGGLLTFFYIVIIQLKIPMTYTNLAIYGIIMDLLFRKLNIFPSLSVYYQTHNYFQTGVLGGAIPMMLPLFFKNKFK